MYKGDLALNNLKYLICLKTQSNYPIGDISTLNGGSLKLLDKFTYLGSSVLSTENDIDTLHVKAWTANGHVEVRPDR